MELFGKKKNIPPVGAVIAAAGSSSRMEGIDKQALEIGGVPVIARSLLCAERCPDIRDIVLVCREEDIPEMLRIAQEFGVSKLRSIVKGGGTRQQSVFAGIAELDGDIRYFAVHDGARPFADGELIRRVIGAALECGAAAPGVRVKDTVKEVGADGFITGTPCRDSLYITQTPQVFEAALYKKAMLAALEQGADYTDDCQLVETAGHRVYMAQGSYRNIKITTPEDIAVAEAIALELDGEDGGLWI